MAIAEVGKWRGLNFSRTQGGRSSYRPREAVAHYFEFCADGTPDEISFLRSAAVSS